MINVCKPPWFAHFVNRGVQDPAHSEWMSLTMQLQPILTNKLTTALESQIKDLGFLSNPSNITISAPHHPA